jgi:hypothetical protein
MSVRFAIEGMARALQACLGRRKHLAYSDTMFWPTHGEAITAARLRSFHI